MCNFSLFGYRLCTRHLIARAWTIYKIGIIYIQTVLDNVSANTTLQEGANQAVVAIRYSWCRAVGFIRAAVFCVCAVGLSYIAVCVQAMWLKVRLQDDT